MLRWNRLGMYKYLFILLTGFHIHLSIHWSFVLAACPWTFFGYCHVVAAGMVLNEEQGSINSVPTYIEQLECPTRALKTWKLEPELEISSSSQVRFNHYQFQVFKFKTWRTRKFQVKSSLKSYKLETRFMLNQPRKDPIL